ncbi:MAG: SAM-dependent methyltransferase [Rhizobiales bacterium]|nr:SAM-dependent methyltransferase [Hyphomicrobiales bacterium]NRB13218.1 SAM-dependent methyltransferase [Hyphomicrobiales bacterium]
MTKIKKNTAKYKLDAKERFLIETGVSDHNGIKPRMVKKYKQICRFTEILADKLQQSGAIKQKRVKVIDIGAGKGYMTFAIYNYLAKNNLDPVIHAVDFNSDLMKIGNETADKCGFENLSFISDFADQYAGLSYYDAVVSLHACDTATDDALFMGLKMKSKIILSAPCCQKEVLSSLKELKSLSEYYKHGLFLHKMADIITDNARVMLLQSQGYQVDVIDFVASEHTQKNTLIAATKKRGKQPAFYEKYQAYKAEIGFAGIKLEQMMLAEGLLE